MADAISLLACSKSKVETNGAAVPAHTLYTGQLFKAQLAYARRVLGLDDRHIFILSAKYGMIRSDEEIATYDLALEQMPVTERVEWRVRLYAKLTAEIMFRKPLTLTVLAGRQYREPAVSEIERIFPLEWVEVVLPTPEGLGYAQQVQWLSKEIERTA